MGHRQPKRQNMKLDELKQNIMDTVDNEAIEDIVCDNLHALDNIANPQDFIEEIRDRIYEQEIIYHSRAMNYLMDNDASLQDSLALAHEYGYTCDKLNSETLATLLYQDNLQRNLSNLEKEITDAIDEYIEGQDEEEADADL
ncbi:MAG: hypothetical protein MJZ20_02900 [Bacteroidaceae bacterium]|nr:hypothetical protein [Bacteroidaceae bacterium]